MRLSGSVTLRVTQHVLDRQVHVTKLKEKREKIMKKVLCLVLVAVMLMFTLTACGKQECDYCGDMRSCKKVTYKANGEKFTYHLCDECIQEIEDDLYDFYKWIG